MTNHLAEVPVYLDYVPTDIGYLAISATERALVSVYFKDQRDHPVCSNAITELAKHQLCDYLSGLRTQFELPLSDCGTHFQRQVWQQLSRIPYGQTCSYGDIAERINNPKAVRAVGSANGKNPFSIIVPCHRVIGANGRLSGYAGGVSRKTWLLQHEQKHRS